MRSPVTARIRRPAGRVHRTTPRVPLVIVHPKTCTSPARPTPTSHDAPRLTHDTRNHSPGIAQTTPTDRLAPTSSRRRHVILTRHQPGGNHPSKADRNYPPHDRINAAHRTPAARTDRSALHSRPNTWSMTSSPEFTNRAWPRPRYRRGRGHRPQRRRPTHRRLEPAGTPAAGIEELLDVHRGDALDQGYQGLAVVPVETSRPHDLLGEPRDVDPRTLGTATVVPAPATHFPSTQTGQFASPSAPVPSLSAHRHPGPRTIGTPPTDPETAPSPATTHSPCPMILGRPAGLIRDFQAISEPTPQPYSSPSVTGSRNRNLCQSPPATVIAIRAAPGSPEREFPLSCNSVVVSSNAVEGFLH